MAGSFGSLEIARSGILVNERSLYVTGHNISNVNTTGFVRQQAMIMDRQTQILGNGFQLGTGADIQEIRQIRNTFLDNIYRKENTSLGYWETINKTYGDIQAILNEPFGESLQGVMNQFWDAWQELSKDPSSLAVRALVRQRAESLVYQINYIGEQIDKLQKDLNNEVKICIENINTITDEIAKLNLEIIKAEVSGDSANDYRDRRNLLADTLSKLVDTNMYYTSDGQLAITIGGHFIVNGSTSTKLCAATDDDSGYFYVPKIEGTDIKVPVKSGILQGLINSRGASPDFDPVTPGYAPVEFSTNILQSLKNSLNAYTVTFINEGNNLHKMGKNMNPAPNNQGTDFFVPINDGKPIGLGNIKLNSNLSDLNYIVASEDGSSGNNNIALKIANLRNKPVLADASGVMSLDEYYQMVIMQVGNCGAYAENACNGQIKLVSAADQYRQSVSGVSMDEEMTNMMKYKYGYNASARTINVIDQMIETIISRMGLVGR